MLVCIGLISYEKSEISRSEWSKIYFNIYIHLLCHNKSIPLVPPYLYDSFDIINANNHEISAINEVRPDLCKQCRICQHKACYWGRGVHDMGCQVVQAVIITGSCIHRHTQRAMLFYV